MDFCNPLFFSFLLFLNCRPTTKWWILPTPPSSNPEENMILGHQQLPMMTSFTLEPFFAQWEFVTILIALICRELSLFLRQRFPTLSLFFSHTLSNLFCIFFFFLSASLLFLGTRKKLRVFTGNSDQSHWVPEGRSCPEPHSRKHSRAYSK